MQTRPIFAPAIVVLAFYCGQLRAESGVSDSFQCPVTVMHQHLYVGLALGQTEPKWWLIDTGSPWSFVGSEQAQRLVKSVPGVSERTAVVRGINSKVLANVEAIVAGNSLGHYDFFETPMADLIDRRHTIDLGYAHTFDTGGILGVDLLVQRAATINFGTARILFARDGVRSVSNRSELEKEGYTYTPIRITSANRVEAIGSVGSDTYSFMIDTGGGRTVLNWAIKTRNEIPVRYGGLLYFGFSHGAIWSGSGFLPSLKLGTQEIARKDVQFATLANRQNGFTHQYGGIIGADTLWAHRAILDIGGRALYLRPLANSK